MFDHRYLDHTKKPEPLSQHMYSIESSALNGAEMSPNGIEYASNSSAATSDGRESRFFARSPENQSLNSFAKAYNLNENDNDNFRQGHSDHWQGQGQELGQDQQILGQVPQGLGMVHSQEFHQQRQGHPYSPHHQLAGSKLADPRAKLQGGTVQHGYYPTVMGGRPQQSLLNSNRQVMGPGYGEFLGQQQYGGMGGDYPGYLQGHMMAPPPPPQHDGKSLNKIMLGIMRDRVFNPNKLTAVLDSNLDIMDCVNLATLLFHTGKKRFTLPPALIQRIATRFNNIDGELRAREASNAMYGLRCMNPERPEVRQLIAALTHKFAASPTKLVAQAVGNAVYGLQSLTSEYEEVRGLLRVLAPKISQCREQLEAQNVGNALYGMKGMSSDYVEVRLLLAALTHKIADVCETLNGQAIGNSLYGLQCCNSREVEVRGILHVLTVLINRSWDSLNTQEIGNSLYGLQRMSSDSVEVRELLQAMTTKISQSAACLDAQAVGNALYGMKNMNTDSPEVRALLEVLGQKIRSSSLVLDGQSIGNGLYGLQAMDSVYPEVRFLVQVLAHKVNMSPVKMNPQELGDAMFGLRRMSADYEEVRELLTALKHKFANCRAAFSVQEIGNMMLGMQGMSSDHPEVRSLLEVMTEKIIANKTAFDGHSCANCMSGLELMSSEHPEVVRLVTVLTMKLRSSSFEHVSPKQLAMCFAGCGRLSFCVPEVSRLLTTLGEKLHHCTEAFTPMQIAMVLQGLKSTYSVNPEVHMILAGLVDKIDLLINAASSGELDPRFLFTFDLLAMSINGLQGMGSVRTDGVCGGNNNAEHGMSGAAVGRLSEYSDTAESILSGLSLNSNDVSSDGVYIIDQLLAKLAELFCLHNGLEFPGVHGGEVVISPDTATNAAVNFLHTDSRTFSDLLYGLQRMESAKSPALVALLEVVRAVCSLAAGSHQVESDEFHIRVDIAVSVGNSMLGLIGCDASLPCVDYLLNTAVTKLEDVVLLFRSVCLDTEGPNQELIYTRMIGLYQPLVLSLHALKATMDSTLYGRFIAQMDILRQLVGSRYADLHPLLYQISSYEMMIAECLHSGLHQQEGVSLSTNDLLYGFPSTILITCTPAPCGSPAHSVHSESELERSVLGGAGPSTDSSSTGSGTRSGSVSPGRGSSPAASVSAPVLINIEIDHCESSSHQHPSTRLLCYLREKYLKEAKGISVIHLAPLQLLHHCDSMNSITAVLMEYFTKICDRAPMNVHVPSINSLTQIADIVVNYVETVNVSAVPDFPELNHHVQVHGHEHQLMQPQRGVLHNHHHQRSQSLQHAQIPHQMMSQSQYLQQQSMPQYAQLKSNQQQQQMPLHGQQQRYPLQQMQQQQMQQQPFAQAQSQYPHYSQYIQQQQQQQQLQQQQCSAIPTAGELHGLYPAAAAAPGFGGGDSLSTCGMNGVSAPFSYDSSSEFGLSGKGSGHGNLNVNAMYYPTTNTSTKQ